MLIWDLLGIFHTTFINKRTSEPKQDRLTFLHLNTQKSPRIAPRRFFVINSVLCRIHKQDSF